MSSLKLGKQSALTLNLQGSTGSFRIGSGDSSKSSLEVKYLLTHVGLNFASSTNDALLSELAPVREIFDFQSLDFDELMQRDIDDSRVSHELIPYLLDENSVDMVKLFPPVVVVVLPLKEGENKPANRYPAVNWVIEREEQDDAHGIRVLRSGEIGEEVFEFEQPVQDGKLLEHDLVKLRLNTKRCRLVIVDGQHRAMSLLALYRNLKEEWSDERRAPFKEYYAEWTPNYIRSFKLDQISLPLMICTIPGIDTEYKGEIDLKQAARSIFLTLNKTARKVSESRNRLLDDNDLVAYFLRECLSTVKEKAFSYPLRISNVELDQVADKAKLQSPMAITGVNHLYYIIEHILLDDSNVKGVSARSGKFHGRKNLDTYGCLKRLNAWNIVGQSIASTTFRDNFSLSTAQDLTKPFMVEFGRYIVKSLGEFRPFEMHCTASLDSDRDLDKHKDRQLRPILFDGQGIGRVFESHRASLAKKLSQNEFSVDVPEIEATLRSLNATASRVESAINNFQQNRAQRYLGDISDKSKLYTQEGELEEVIIKWVNTFYQNILTTVAFQSALICGFFNEIERVNNTSSKAGFDAIDTAKAYKEYLVQINQFFIPNSVAQLKKLIRVFSGEIDGQKVSEWKIVGSKYEFRSVVYRGEMQPDQWPKYKYLLLEVWDSSIGSLQVSLSAERVKCRKQVFSSLVRSYKTEFCRENQRLEQSLTDSERKKIEKQAFDSLHGMLKNIGTTALPKIEDVQASVEEVNDMIRYDDSDEG